MRPTGTLLKTHHVDPATIRVAKSEFDTVVTDMLANAGPLMPTLNWLTADSAAPASHASEGDVVSAFSDDEFARRFSTMAALMDAWVGNIAMQPLQGEMRARYQPLLTEFDPLGLWQANVEESTVAATLLNSDLGSILDVDVLYAFASQATEPTRILEVGAGFGRLPEAMFNVFGDSVRYVLIDSVPASICYLRAYLAAACPDVRVGYYYDGDEFDLDRFHAYIAPSWHFERLNNQRYDVCVNVESFQEMSQDHLDRYLAMFNAVTGEGGLIYSSNARGYAFKGEWRFPPHWRKLLAVETPRSWTDDHPTEVFVKSAGDFSLPNALLDAIRRHPEGPRDLRSAVRVTRSMLARRMERSLPNRLRRR